MKLATFTPTHIKPLVPEVPLTPMELRERIEDLTAMIVAAPDAPYETRHYYADGLYAREIHVPAGTWVVGSIHRFEHINVLSKGDVSIVTEAGPKHLSAPATFPVKAGSKTLGYAHSDTVWTTFCVNADNERDPAVLFDRLITPEYLDAPKLTKETVAWLS